MASINTIRGGFSGIGGVLNSVGPKEAEYIGSTMAFAQASAPFRWVKVTTYNDYCIRIVNGTATTSAIGKDVSTVFTNNTIYSPFNLPSVSTGTTSLSTTQIAAHTHPINLQKYPANPNFPGGSTVRTVLSAPGTPTSVTSGSPSVGAGSGHSHTATVQVSINSPFNFAVKYIDVILATY
jgi:hypothetical protein